MSQRHQFLGVTGGLWCVLCVLLLSSLCNLGCIVGGFKNAKFKFLKSTMHFLLS